MSVKTKKTMKTWLKGLLAAALGGGLMVIVDPESILDNPRHSAKLAAGGAVIAVIGYLKKSPFPAIEDVEAESDAK